MTDTPRLRTVGVVGAGVIGAGVAEALAMAGHHVVLADVDDTVLDHAVETMRRSLAGRRLLAKEAPRPEEVLARVEPVTSLDAMAGAKFVVENVTERWEVKEPVWRRLDEVCDADTVFAANTSAIPITKLAGLTARAPQVLGIHFMNPVPLKETVEVIRTPATSDETLRIAHDLLASMGKAALVVGDAPGFVSNRVLMLTINEALAVLDDGVADAATIDQVFTECFGHPMGPLATADLIGLDTVAHTLEILRTELRDERFAPTPALSKLVADGRLGRKSGSGIFDYPARR